MDLGEMTPREEWRPVDGFPNYYVSSEGRVRGASGRILVPVPSAGGYCVVTLRRDMQSFTKRVHVLVCETFHGPRPSSRHQAAHNDGVRGNNFPINLRWATPEENQADRILHGTDTRGSEVFGAVLSEEQIPVIRRLLDQHVPGVVIARAFNVSPSTISLIGKDKIWRHAA